MPLQTVTRGMPHGKHTQISGTDTFSNLKALRVDHWTRMQVIGVP